MSTIKALLTLFSLTLILQLSAQPPTWNWANSINTTQDEAANDVVVEAPTGNIYVTGYWENNLTAYYTPTGIPSTNFTSTYGSEDGFVAKYDNTGSVIWAFKIGGPNIDHVNSIVVDNDGSIYITGYIGQGVSQFTGVSTLTGTTSVNNTDASNNFFIAKYTTDGALAWVRQSTSSQEASGFGITVNSTGVYASGHYNNSTTFGSITVPDNGILAQAFVIKYDKNGTEQWIVRAEVNDPSYFRDVAADEFNVYAIGDFEGWNFALIDKDGTEVATLTNSMGNRTDIALISISSNGTFNWIQQIGGINNEKGNSLTLDADSIYITGGVGNNCSFPGYTANPITSSGNTDIFISSHSKADGTTGWAHSFTCSDGGNEEASSVTMDSFNNLVFTGNFKGTLNFPATSLATSGQEDVFVASYTNDGEFFWAKKSGGGGKDFGLGISSNSTDKIYVAGSYEDNSAFDLITLPDNNRSNLFFGELNPCLLPVGGNATTTDSLLCIGENTTLTLTGYSGYIQWQSSPKGAGTWGNIAGQTTATLAINPSVSTDYRALVSSLSCGSIYSDILTVEVYPLPTGLISGNATICAGSSTPLNFVFTGTAPYNFTYTNGTSSYDVLAHPSNNHSVNVTPAVNSTYTISSISDLHSCVNTGTGSAVITLTPLAAITVHPVSKTLCPGSNTNFSVTATGLNLGYQWRKDGTDMPGENSSTLLLNAVDATDVASYSCVVISTCGGPVISNGATLSLNSSVNITTHPSSQLVCSGQNITLAVTATGSNLTYQWRKNGSPIADGGNLSGTNTDVITITGIFMADAGSYSCLVTGSCGSGESNAAIIQVDDIITITSQPANQLVCPDGSASFSVMANGTNLIYQWQKNGVNMPGKTSMSLVINNCAVADEASYRCVVSSPCGQFVNSATALLSLYTETAINEHPAGEIRCLGDDIGFTVMADGSNLTYQWKKDGINLANGGSITGATSNNLFINGLIVADAGAYTCQVTGSCGVLSSNPAILIVDDAIAITTQPQNKTACQGDNINFNLVATGSNLSYQWQKDGIDMAGRITPSLSLNNVDISNVGNYRCIISNSCGASLTSNVVNLSLYTITQITSDPADQTECIGNNVSFDVTATGSNLVYQWKKDGVNLVNDARISGVSSNNLFITNLLTTDIGTYVCQVTGSCGLLNSNPADLLVDDNIVISDQPQNQQACRDENVSFEITAAGSGLNYQWQKNGVNIIGENSPVLALNTINDGDVGAYRCILSNSCGANIISNVADLTLYDNTVITVQPTGASECEGGNVNFTVSASGSGLLFQWRKNGANLSDGGNISGSTANTLQISNITTADEAVYTCLVSGNCGSQNSNPANLTIKETVNLTLQPSNLTVCEGNNANFTVFATGTNLTYQWQRNGVNIAGETNSGILLNNVTPANAGIYRCIVTGDCETVYSNGALLTVNLNTSITLQPTDDIMCEGDNAGFVINATGTGLNYQWTFNGVDLSDGGNITGASTSSLSVNPVSTSNAGVYECVVSGACGNVTSNPADLVVNEVLSITSQPVNSIVCENGNVTFSVSVSGTIISYQWQKNGVNIAGEVSSGLVLNNVTLADAGVYRCFINGDCGSVISNGALLTVNKNTVILAQPVNETVCEGTNSGFTISADGTTLSYQWKHNGISLTDNAFISGSTTNNLIISPSTLPYNGTYVCEVTGVCGPVNSIPANLVVNENLNITSQPQNITVCEGGNASFSITATGSSVTYQWQKDGIDLAGETGSGIIINNVDETDEGLYRCIVNGSCGTQVSNGALLTVTNPPVITIQPTNISVCSGGNVNLTVGVTGSGLSYQWKRNGTDLVNGAGISGVTTNNLSIVNATALNAGVYLCEITGSCGSINSNPANLVINENILITSHPQNLTVCENDNISFGVSATGSNLSYQWQKNGANIAGETANSLVINNVSAADAGIFRCLVSGTCGSSYSNGASLVVRSEVVITGQPLANVSLCQGNNVNLSVVATGSNLAYQWVKDGTDMVNGGNVTGVTTNNLIINNITSANPGIYNCKVTGSCGFANSNFSNLVVYPTTSVIQHPVTYTVVETGTAVFSVMTSGNNITYQWEKDGISLTNGGKISGATTANLTLTGVAESDEGAYRCFVSGTCGNVYSNPASLVVNPTSVITSQPSGISKCEGESASFGIVATGTGLTYQWKKDGVNLVNNSNVSGVLTANLTITSISLTDAGAYTCEVNGETSSPAILTVNTNTLLTLNPVNAVKCAGDIAAFAIEANGTNLSYQWQRNGLNISDAGNVSGTSTKVVTITNVTNANEGNYRCVVTGICGTSNSTPATLLVNDNTQITLQPAGSTLCQGESVILHVVSNGDNLSYQWKKDGTPVTDGGNISGSSTANLNISNSLVSNTGSYTCDITGICGNENSLIANLIVNPGTVIVSQPVAVSACFGENIYFAVGATGTNLNYQWQKDGINLSDGASISGSLTPVLSITAATDADNGSYRCVVTGTCGTVNSNPAPLNVRQNTQITLQPAGSVLCEGTVLTLTVGASGHGLNYQWKKDGINLANGGNISGATTANLTLTGLIPGNTGFYSCEVTGNCGSENSDLANLVINRVTQITTQPISSVHCEGDVASFSVLASGENLTYQWQKNGVNLADGGTISGTGTNFMVINSLIPDDSGSYRCVVTGTCGNMNSNPALLTVNQNITITTQPLGNTICAGNSITLGITASGDDLQYQWKKDGVALVNGGNINGVHTPDLSITNISVTNAGAYTCTITNNCETENSDIAVLTVNSDIALTSQPADIARCTGDNASFIVTATGANLTWQWQKDGIDISDGGTISGSTTSVLTINGIVPADNAAYRCVVTGTCGYLISDPAVLTSYLNTVITLQPIGDSVCEGGSVTLLVVSQGENNSYQWKKDGVIINDNGNITGSSTSMLSVNNSSLTDEGVYHCEVTGGCGIQNSNSAAITVSRNTVITAQPAGLSKCTGDIAVYKVTAEGDNITYQWEKDGIPLIEGGDIFGPSTPILTLNNLDVTDAGIYRCFISGECGNLYSEPAGLTVNVYPDAAGNIIGPVTVCQGEDGVIYEIPAINYADTYNWTVPAGVNVISGNNTRLINVAFGEGESGGQITVYGQNVCGTGTISPALTVTAFPIPEVNAGEDKNVCASATILEGNDPVIGSGHWDVIGGPAIVQVPGLFNSTVTDLRRGENILVWTITRNGCSYSDTVYIYNNTVDIDAGENLTICSESITLNGSAVPSGAFGYWSVVTGNATFTNGSLPNPVASGFASGINRLTWSVTQAGCVNIDSVFINNQRPTVPYAGIDQLLCRDTTRLNANNPVYGSALWTVVQGSVTFDNNIQYNTLIRNIGQGDNVLRWTITNGICSLIDEVTISNNKVTAGAGIDQVLCDRTTTMSATEPLSGIGNWSVINGSAVFVDINLHNSLVTGLSKGTNTLQWVVNKNNCLSTDTVVIINDSPTQSDAGDDQIVYANYATLQGNIPDVGTGRWTLISGAAQFDDENVFNTNVTGLNLGQNIFRWIITHNACTSSDDVTVTNYTPNTTDAGNDQTLCTNNTYLDGNEPVFGFGEWSVISGSAQFQDNSNPKTRVTGLGFGENTLRWTVWENGYTFDDVVIINNSPSTPNAGVDQIICLDSTALFANNPVYGTGNWTVSGGSAIFEDSTIYNSRVRNLAPGENKLKWTITNKGCILSDIVTINNGLPSTAVAGGDQTTCTGTVILTPNTPSVGAGSWSVIRGSANFTGNTVSSLATDTNIVRWTIATDHCTSYDEVTLVNNKPSNARAGADKIICQDSLVLAANSPLVGSGVWTIQNGSVLFEDVTKPNSIVTDLSQGINVLRWTISYNGCVSFDEVRIDNALVDALTGPGQTLCATSTVLEANNPIQGTGTWSVVGGSGSAIFEDPNQPDTRVTGLDKGNNVLRWTIQNGICSSYSDVVIVNNLPTTSLAGPDQTICSDSATLKGNTPAIGTGMWTILGGSGAIISPSLYNSKINNLGNGVNTLRWTITNQGCTSTDEMVIFNNSASISVAGDDQSVCSDSARLYGNNPAYGTGSWSVVSGSSVFADNTYYNTDVTELGKGSNQLRWIITNGQCSTYDDVTITNNMPMPAVAGADQTVCGDAAGLSANIPLIGYGEWSLISGSAYFMNPFANNTLVTDLRPGNNTLRWTVTNNGCSLYDEVLIFNDLPEVADAGADITVCENIATLFANNPPGGTGEWTVLSGSAYVTNSSLYNTTVSDLEFGNTTLRWTIQFARCTTSDEIIITNNRIAVFAGQDQTIGKSYTMLAASNPSIGSGQWTVSAGSGSIQSAGSSITQVTGLGGGLNTFRWSVDVNGCISHDDVSVTYNVPPVASFVADRFAGCSPLEVYFVNNSLNTLPFTWDFGDGSTSNEVSTSHIFYDPGFYTVSLTIIGNAGEVITRDTLIQVYDQPEASFNIVAREVYIPEQNAMFINTSTNANSFIWLFGDTTSSTERDPQHVYDYEGSYAVTLMAISGNNCIDTLVVENAIEVFESGSIQFPNAFSPNKEGPTGGTYSPGDFSNDAFYPIGEGVADYHMEIFNRWGILVFESDDITIGWDGYYNGELLNPGVYVYKVTGTYNNGKRFTKIGSVMLLH